MTKCPFTQAVQHAAVGAGLIYLGYRIGARNGSNSNATGTGTKSSSRAVSKSYERGEETDAHRVISYCIEHSTQLHPVQKELIAETLKHTGAKMMGAPEVILINSAFIRTRGQFAKECHINLS